MSPCVSLYLSLFSQSLSFFFPSFWLYVSYSVSLSFFLSIYFSLSFSLYISLFLSINYQCCTKVVYKHAVVIQKYVQIYISFLSNSRKLMILIKKNKGQVILSKKFFLIKFFFQLEIYFSLIFLVSTCKNNLANLIWL